MTDPKPQPFMKFFPSSWRAEATTRVCSYAARGLWMEMLMLMHPDGRLVHRDKPMTTKRIARLTAGPEEEVKKLIEEMEEEGVFSREPDGTIFCRRSVRDRKTFLNCSEGGTKGAKKRWGKGNESEETPITPPNGVHDNSLYTLYSNLYSLTSDIEGVRGGKDKIPDLKPPGVWIAILEELREIIDEENFDTWLKTIKPLGIDKGDVLWIASPSKFHADWIFRKFRERIVQAAEDRCELKEINLIIQPEEETEAE